MDDDSSDLDTNRGPLRSHVINGYIRDNTWNLSPWPSFLPPPEGQAINLKPASALKTAPGGGGCPMTSMGMLATNPQTETGQRIYSAVCPTRLKK